MKVKINKNLLKVVKNVAIIYNKKMDFGRFKIK